MKQEQIHDALNLLDDELIEEVDALRDKAGLNSEFPEERSCVQSRNKSWMKYVPLVACLCVVIVGAFVWQHYRVNFVKDNTCDGAGNTDWNDEDLDGMPESDILAGGQGHSEEIENGITTNIPDYGATDTGVNIGEVPSVLVRIDEWQEDGFLGAVAGLVDTDIFSVGAELRVIFNENISVGVKISGGVRFENGAPDKEDFPVGSVVRVQFTKHEPASGGTDNTEDERTIFAELIEMSDEDKE